MTALPTGLRRRLENTVLEARVVAEVAAREALEALAVSHYEPFSHLMPDDRVLRNRLRAHARQLGDSNDRKSGRQQTERLIRECAYEQWHRMLFARFLAENQLLIEPDLNVPISLDECEELAASGVPAGRSVAPGFLRS